MTRRRHRDTDDPAHMQRHLEQQRANKLPRKRRARLQPAGNVLRDVLRDMKLLSRMRMRRLHKAWAAALDHDTDELAHTRVVRLAHGELTVELDAAGRVQDYARFRCAALVQRLNTELAGKPLIVGIRFVLGTFVAHDPPPPPDTKAP